MHYFPYISRIEIWTLEDSSIYFNYLLIYIWIFLSLIQSENTDNDNKINKNQF